MILISTGLEIESLIKKICRSSGIEPAFYFHSEKSLSNFRVLPLNHNKPCQQRKAQLCQFFLVPTTARPLTHPDVVVGNRNEVFGSATRTRPSRDKSGPAL